MKERTKVVIVDIDGTVADLTHRLHYIKDKDNKDWENFYDKMTDDTPIAGAAEYIVSELAKLVDLDTKLHFIFVTGRRDTHRAQTVEWLEKHCPLAAPGYYTLIMRRAGDTRTDVEVKEEIYDIGIAPTRDVVAAFEDRPRIIELWKRKGIPTFKMGNWEEHNETTNESVDTSSG